jgi:site-specific DNA recombinase
VRVALYLRQSLDVQEGIDRQRLRTRALAASREWEIVEEYEDNDTSASKARKAGTAWAQMLDDARARRFEVVIAVDLDRLVRTIKDLSTLTETGARVLTVDGEIDLTTADGEFRATMLAGIARFETRRKGERQKRANAHAASLGRPAGGRRPFGYEQDGMTVRPEEAAAIVDAYRDFLTGVPLAAIARDWNARGLTTTQARYKGAHKGEPGTWTHSSVRGVLENARYMAKRSHLGVIVTDGIWPAIVEESTWQSVHAILKDPARQQGQLRGRYLLSGLALCGVCRSTVHAAGNARAGVPGYRCSGSMGHFARRSAPVDEYVEAVIVGRLSRDDARDLLAHEPETTGHDLALEAVGVRARLDSLAVDYADDALTTSQFRIATGRLRDRLAQLEDKMAVAGRVDVLGPLISAGDVREAWTELSSAKKRAVIATLASIVIYPPGRGVRHFDPDSVGIEWAQ